jgi:membrane-associated HD superfamily phosphohydrolase
MRLLNRQREEGIRLRITRGATSVDELDVKEDFSEFIPVQDAVERLAVMARRGLKGVDPELRDRLVDVAGRLVVPNCQYNRVETESRREKARASVENLSTTRPFRKGQIIVDRGHIVTGQHVRIARASLQEIQDEDLLLALLGNLVVVVGLTFIMVSFFRRFIRKFAVDKKDLIFLGIWSVVTQ